MAVKSVTPILNVSSVVDSLAVLDQIDAQVVSGHEAERQECIRLLHHVRFAMNVYVSGIEPVLAARAPITLYLRRFLSTDLARLA